MYLLVEQMFQKRVLILKEVGIDYKIVKIIKDSVKQQGYWIVGERYPIFGDKIISKNDSLETLEEIAMLHLL